MDARIVVALHLVLMSLISHGHIVDQEHPRCYSTFDYQEKLLEKMATLTESVQTLEEQLDTKFEELATASEKVREDEITIGADFSKLESHLKREFVRNVETMIEVQSNGLDANSQKIDALVDETGAKVDKLSEDFRAMTNGSMTKLQESVKPNVAFVAKGATPNTPGKNRKLVFVNTLLNTDNSYSRRTGEFTAPVGGTYWFSSQICGYSREFINFRIYVNDVIMSDTTHHDGADSNSCTSSTTVAILSKGDRVYVKTGEKIGNGGIHQGDYMWAMFMGSLVN